MTRALPTLFACICRLRLAWRRTGGALRGWGRAVNDICTRTVHFARALTLDGVAKQQLDRFTARRVVDEHFVDCSMLLIDECDWRCARSLHSLNDFKQSCSPI
jgi:hypothetical protein